MVFFLHYLSSNTPFIALSFYTWTKQMAFSVCLSLRSFLKTTLNPSEGLNPRNLTLLTLKSNHTPRILVLQPNPEECRLRDSQRHERPPWLGQVRCQEGHQASRSWTSGERAPEVTRPTKRVGPYWDRLVKHPYSTITVLLQSFNHICTWLVNNRL